MISALELVLLFLILPGGLAWMAGKFDSVRNAFVATLSVGLSAALPALWIYYETQQADGITRAASTVVTPVLFFLMLIPAAVGHALGKPRERS